MDRVFQAYTRQHRALIRSVAQEKLPHPETFYSDVFATAHSLVSQRKSARDCEYYRQALFHDLSKFFTLVLKVNEERHASAKYTGHIDFTSQFEFAQNGKPGAVKRKPAEIKPATSLA